MGNRTQERMDIKLDRPMCLHAIIVYLSVCCASLFAISSRKPMFTIACPQAIQEPESTRASLAGLMCHSMSTHNRYYAGTRRRSDRFFAFNRLGRLQQGGSFLCHSLISFFRHSPRSITSDGLLILFLQIQTSTLAANDPGVRSHPFQKT